MSSINKVIAQAVKGKHHLLLVGETGSGKTTMVAEYAKSKNKILHRVSISADTSKDDLLGRQTLIDGNIIWVDGIVTTALRNGDWLVLDEINMAGGDLTATLHSLTDEAASVLLEANHNEVVKAKASFRLFATMNPPEADYGGTKPLNQAFASRFIIANVEYLPLQEEAKLVAAKTGIAIGKAENITELAHAIRLKKSLGDLGYAPSTRDVVQWAQLIAKGVDETEAFELSVANKAMTERESVTRIAAEHNTQYQRLIESIEQQHGVSSREELMQLATKVAQEKRDLVGLTQTVRAKVEVELAGRAKAITDREQAFREKTADIDKKLADAYERGKRDAAEKHKQLLTSMIGA